MRERRGGLAFAVDIVEPMLKLLEGHMSRPSNMLEWLAKPSARIQEKRMTLQMAGQSRIGGR